MTHTPEKRQNKNWLQNDQVLILADGVFKAAVKSMLKKKKKKSTKIRM